MKTQRSATATAEAEEVDEREARRICGEAEPGAFVDHYDPLRTVVVVNFDG